MKHVTLWCYPRTGTTAYCEHLVNTKKVDSDELQEFLESIDTGHVFMMTM